MGESPKENGSRKSGDVEILFFSAFTPFPGSDRD